MQAERRLVLRCQVRALEVLVDLAEAGTAERFMRSMRSPASPAYEPAGPT